MLRFMIAGLLAAIGAVVLAGQSHADNRYCSYYPEDPNCYEALYGAESAYEKPEAKQEQESFDDSGPAYRPLPRQRPFVRQVESCEIVGRELRKFGYRNVRPVECSGKNFQYVAYLGYQRFMVKVNSRSGAIVYEINY